MDYDSSLLGVGGSASRARLGRTQEDLNKYRQRIDANVEQQKEYSEIIADMQSKAGRDWGGELTQWERG